MPDIVTFSEMRSYLRENANSLRGLESSMTYDSATFSDSPKNVFLSHSSKDKELLPYVVKTLSAHGGRPYIDLGDARLPNPPSVETAKVLKDAIARCRRFVVFVTTNSKESKWIPWELGLGDGAKENYDIALFPSAENTTERKWLEQEYLGLYRQIVWGSHKAYEKKVWMVWDHVKNEATELSKWLAE